MTGTMSAPLNAEQRVATRRIAAFRQRFGDGHFYLACHAALPLALTPDLLYCLWVNFQQDSHHELLDVPWIAVSDLILSNLCEEVGYELYEMDAPTRSELLKQLHNDFRFGLERIRELADFVMMYVEQQLDNSDLDIHDFAKTQKWGALAYKNPAAAVHEIALALARLNLADKTEWIRMAELLTTLEEPLAEFSSLLTYASAMKDFARGNKDSATAKFSQILDSTYSLQVAGVALLVPESIKINKSQSLSNPASPKIHQINYLQHYFLWLVTGGLTLGLTLVYFLQPNQPLSHFLQFTQSPPSPSTTASSPTNRPKATSSADTTRQPTQISSPTPSSATQPSPSPSIVASISPQPSPIKISPFPVPNPSTNGTSTGVSSVSPTPRPTETAKPGSQTDMALRLGSRGSDVLRLQQRLRQLGWDVAVDGVFGPATQQALLDFQLRNGLAADGIFSSATQNALSNGISANIPFPVPNPSTNTSASVPSISPTPQPTELKTPVETQSYIKGPEAVKRLKDTNACPGCDLSNENLQNFYLENANLQGANLPGTSLKGANLRNANLRNANLNGANLLNADLRGADLTGANLNETVLTGVIR